MKPIILNLFDHHPLAKIVAENLDFDIGQATLRTFPDTETYLRLHDSLQNRDVIIIDSLDRPNQKILPLLFAAETAKDLGAKRVGLCTPYLPYMRQDKRFQAGEAITSNCFSTLISRHFDWLVTVDPHLHRHHNLSEIYSIPSSVIHAAPEISRWVQQHIENPIFIGPDKESEQWVADVAHGSKAPYLILQKIRRGDRQVEISFPDKTQLQNHTPVLVDDIISTGQTMLETLKLLKKVSPKQAVCIGVHAVFADNTYERLCEFNAEQIITCNTIPHISNQIDLSTTITTEIQRYVKAQA